MNMTDNNLFCNENWSSLQFANKTNALHRQYWTIAATAKGQTLKRILCAAKTYNCSSAECERGFSAANNTVTPMHNRLSAKSLASLLFIELNGPPAASFKPQNYVKSWVLYKDITCQGQQNLDQVHCQANQDHYGQYGIKFQTFVKKLTFIWILSVYELVNSTQL